jgi:hypothetical protein
MGTANPNQEGRAMPQLTPRALASASSLLVRDAEDAEEHQPMRPHQHRDAEDADGAEEHRPMRPHQHAKSL